MKGSKMAKTDKALKKDAVDLNGNIIRTTEQEESMAREQLEAQRAKEEADKGTSEDLEAAERKRVDLNGEEIISEDAKPVESNVVSDDATEDDKEVSEQDSESSEDAGSSESAGEESEKSEDEKSEDSENAGNSDDDSKSEGSESEENSESAEEGSEEDKSESESSTSDDESKSEESKEEVKEEAEKGDFDTRLTKMEEKIDQLLSALTKSEGVENTDSAVAEEKSEEAEADSEKSTDEAQKSENSDMQKVTTDSQITKLEGELSKAQSELLEKVNELNELKKMAKPSKILSPFAMAKGMEFFKEPENELAQIKEQLKKFDDIKESRNLTEAEQKAAFRLVKVKKDIEYQLS